MTKTTKKWFSAGSLCIFLLMALTGAAFSAEEATYRLKWLFNTSVVGDLYAKDYGYFDKAGLSVTVKEGGPERDAIKELELGYAQFGVASADQVIRARSKGAPVIVIAQLFQVNPLQWIYRADTVTIKQISDLKGKTLGITYGGNDETIMRTLLAKANITEKDVSLFSVRYDYTPFYQKKVDIWPVYRNSQGITVGDKLRAEGEEVNFLNPADHGVKFVANSVVTSEKMIKEKPEVVKAFVTALMQAWEASLDPANKKKALSLLEKYDKDTTADVRNRQLALTSSFVKPAADVKIGTIDMGAWKQTEAIMLEQKQIPKPVKVEKAIDSSML
jgi:NitT/TauT family transport system substrate-binding protein